MLRVPNYDPDITALTVATWNVDWASRRSKRFAAARERIAELDSDLLVLTETTLDLVPDGGYVAEGGTEWGYPVKEGRRKVLLWSKWPLSDVANDQVEPAGRHVFATADTPTGPIRVHGVCIPWSHSNVTWGRRDKKPWQEHREYLGALRDLLARERATGDRPIPVLMAGDFNQKGEPKPYGSRAVRDAWSAIRSTYELKVATDDQIIDKVVVGPGLSAAHARLFPGGQGFDHSAVSCRVSVV